MKLFNECSRDRVIFTNISSWTAHIFTLRLESVDTRSRISLSEVKAANLHALTSNDLKSLGVFAPAEFTTFKVPYIPIPVSEMEFSHLSDYARGDTKSLVQFEKGGRKYVRFFVHPNYVSAYADLIERHGIVYQYDAMTTSSPRSLIVMDAEKPGEVHWVKVSIHKEIDGSVRINTDKKSSPRDHHERGD